MKPSIFQVKQEKLTLGGEEEDASNIKFELSEEISLNPHQRNRIQSRQSPLFSSQCVEGGGPGGETDGHLDPGVEGLSQEVVGISVILTWRTTYLVQAVVGALCSG